MPTKIYYKLYIKQGKAIINVIDWTKVNKIYNSNTLNIDTTWLVPQTYFLDLKVERNGAVFIYNEELKFTISLNFISRLLLTSLFTFAGILNVL